MLSQPCVDALPGGGNGRDDRRDANQRRVNHGLKHVTRGRQQAAVGMPVMHTPDAHIVAEVL
jgi:hypothetical protein